MTTLDSSGWAVSLQAALQPPGFFLQSSQPLHNPAEPDSGGDSENDSLALLPKRTVVRIVGNARTKGTLIGETCIVKRAVGLGGWHWLQVLRTGEEVKLQRNALEVLERPTANEQDMSEEEEEELRRQQQQQQQQLAARGYPYEPAEPHAEDRPRPPRRPSSVPPQPRLDDHLGRTRLHSARGASQPRINLSKLQTTSLKRYGAVYHLPSSDQASRDQLLDAVSEHFASQQVDEGEVIACFLSAIKRHRMGLPR